MAVVQVACGSWSDPEYAGILYPPGLPAAQRLGGYARWFGHVEVNASFYTIPSRATATRWHELTPPGFFFDLKLHKTVSGHAACVGDLPAALRPAGAPSSRPLELGAPLLRELAAYTLDQFQPLARAKKLGAFLLLLPPRFAPETRRLEEFDPLVEALRGHPLAVELRHRGWVEGPRLARTLAWFRERGVAWVAVDMPRVDATNVMPPVDEVTQPKLAYLRLHGRHAEGYLHGRTPADRFRYDYPAGELREIVGRIGRLAAQADYVRVVASNHAENFAPKAALALKRLLGQPLPDAVDTQKELF